MKKLKPHGRHYPPIIAYDIRLCTRPHDLVGHTLCIIACCDYATVRSAYTKSYRIKEALNNECYGNSFIVIRRIYE